MRRLSAVLSTAFSTALCLSALAFLAGCSTVRTVESDVTAFTTQPVAAGGTYRFERLPSQQQTGPTQAGLEVMADQALARIGMRRDDEKPRYSIQIGARVQRFERGPFDDPFWPGYGVPHRDFVVTASGQVVSIPAFPRMGMSMPWYEREVSLVIRDLANGQVVYETHARNDGRWSDSQNIFPAMFQAALMGFPAPPQGVRRVNVDIGQTG